MRYEKDRTLLTAPELSQATQDKIIELAETGLDVTSICIRAGIGETTFIRFRTRDPAFAARWELARQASSEILADRLLTLGEDVDSVHSAMAAKLRSDNIRSVVAWRNPRVYGQKLNVDVTHSIDLSGALIQANNRVSLAVNDAKQALEHAETMLPKQLQSHKTDAIEVLPAENKQAVGTEQKAVIPSKAQTNAIDVELAENFEDLL